MPDHSQLRSAQCAREVTVWLGVCMRGRLAGETRLLIPRKRPNEGEGLLVERKRGELERSWCGPTARGFHMRTFLPPCSKLTSNTRVCCLASAQSHYLLIHFPASPVNTSQTAKVMETIDINADGDVVLVCGLKGQE